VWVFITAMIVCATVAAAYAEYLRRDRDRLKKELEELKRRESQPQD